MQALKKGVLFLALCAFLPAASVWAAGQGEAKAAGVDYPTKPIQFVVPANPGGGTDLGARLLAEYLKDEIGQNIVITNMPGAGGTVAANHVHDAKPDGYTVLYQHEAFVANRVFGLSEYTLRDDYVTVGGPFEVDTVCLFSKTISNWDELKKKATEGEVILGTEVGTSFHILYAAIKDKSGLNIKFVDTGAVSPTLAAMEGGQIDIALVPLGVIKDAVEAGRYHVIGLTSAQQRSKFFPDIPTMKELGVDVYLPKFFFLALPPGTPEAVSSKLQSALESTMQNPELKEKARSYYYKADYMSPQDIYSKADATYDLLSRYVDLIKK